jgi:hypothetical protein
MCEITQNKKTLPIKAKGFKWTWSFCSSRPIPTDELGEFDTTILSKIIIQIHKEPLAYFADKFCLFAYQFQKSRYKEIPLCSFVRYFSV